MRQPTKTFWAIFICATTAVLLALYPSCNYNSNPYHNFLQTEEYKKLSREEQLAKCGTCHAKEYASEMAGPHANAHKKLMEHISFINSDKYDCEFYTIRTNRQLEDCMECHSPVNLWETQFKNAIADKPKMADTLLEFGNSLPDSRNPSAQRSTGVDCFSCHYNGKEILALKFLPTEADSILSKFSMRKLTADNLTCYPCHDNEFKTFTPSIAINKKGTVQCISCHQEYDAQGKGTHYYYWAHNASGKTDAKIISMMDDFRLQFSSDRKSAEIIWQNTSVPHQLAPFPETILQCEVLNKDSQVLGMQTIRLNNRREFNKHMYESLGNNYLFGIDGDDVLLDNTSRKYPITVSKPAQAELFKISVYHKGQYWFPDSLKSFSAAKVYAVNP